MRMLSLAVAMVALGGGSYWALTAGPFAPGGGGVDGVVSELTAARSGDGDLAYTGEQAIFPRLEYTPYPIAGGTELELLEAMLARGPRAGDEVFFGLTTTELDVRYDPVEVAGGCLIRDVQVFIDIRIILPDWAPPAGVDPALAAEWARFRRALKAHEVEHGRIALAGAERSHLAIAELFRPTCEEAVEEARRRLERIGVEGTATHRRFDAETAHGRTEGAAWPLQD